MANSPIDVSDLGFSERPPVDVADLGFKEVAPPAPAKPQIDVSDLGFVEAPSPRRPAFAPMELSPEEQDIKRQFALARKQPAAIKPPAPEDIASLRERVKKAAPEWDYSRWQEESAMSDFGPPLMPPREALLKDFTPDNIRRAKISELADNYLNLAEAAPTFGGGIVKALSGPGGFNKAYPFIGGIISAQQKSLRNELLAKMRSGGKLDDAEQTAVDAMALAERRVEQPQKFWEKVAQITGESVPYALEFGMTGGVYGAVRQAGGKVAGRLLGVAAQTAVGSAPRVADEYLDRISPQWRVDKKTLAATIDDQQADKDWMAELVKAGGSQYIENLSERTGSIVGRVIPREAIAKIFRLGAIKTWMDSAVSKSAGAQSVREAAKLARGAMSFNGVPEEIAEEYIGSGLKALTGIDDQHNVLASLQAGDTAGALANFIGSLPFKETPAMAVSFGLVPTAQRAAELGAAATAGAVNRLTKGGKDATDTEQQPGGVRVQPAGVVPLREADAGTEPRNRVPGPAGQPPEAAPAFTPPAAEVAPESAPQSLTALDIAALPPTEYRAWRDAIGKDLKLHQQALAATVPVENLTRMAETAQEHTLHYQRLAREQRTDNAVQIALDAAGKLQFFNETLAFAKQKGVIPNGKKEKGQEGQVQGPRYGLAPTAKEAVTAPPAQTAGGGVPEAGRNAAIDHQRVLQLRRTVMNSRTHAEIEAAKAELDALADAWNYHPSDKNRVGVGGDDFFPDFLKRKAASQAQGSPGFAPEGVQGTPAAKPAKSETKSPEMAAVDLTVSGQGRPIPGRPELQYTVHMTRKEDVAARGKFKVTITKPSSSLVVPIRGFGDTAEAAYARAVDQLADVPILKQPAAPTPKAATDENLAALTDKEFDELLNEAEEEAAPTPAPAPKPKSAIASQPKAKTKRPRSVRTEKPESPKEHLTDAAKAMKNALDEAAKGLDELFGGGKRMGTGPSFDEETYRKAKPHFDKAWEETKKSGGSLLDFLKAIIKRWGEKIKPYLQRWRKDLQAATKGETDESTRRPLVPQPADVAEGQPAGPVPGTGTPPEGTAVGGGSGSAVGKPNAPSDVGAGGKPGSRRGGRAGATVSGGGTAGGTTPGERPGVEQGPRTDEVFAGPDRFPEENLRIQPGDTLAPTSRGDRIKANLKAITLSKKLAAENRLATSAEKRIIMQFSGWGDTFQVFGMTPIRQGLTADDVYQLEKGGRQIYNLLYRPDERERYEKWKKQYAAAYDAVKESTTPEEWESFKGSSLNAHYTNKAGIQALWGIVQRLGWNGGVAIEPSAGIGSVIGLTPDALAGRVHWIGVELDALTAQMLKQLYPRSDIQNTGFEKANRAQNNSANLVITNFPFGDYPIVDTNHPDYDGWSVHNYFLARSIDTVKPGGLVVAITSHHTLDATGGKPMRDWLSSRADMIGAIRMPNTAFKESAGTEVVTDILVFRKKDGINSQHGQRFASLAKIEIPAENRSTKRKEGESDEAFAARMAKPVLVNEYFVEHPEMVLGTHSTKGTMYAGDTYTVMPRAEVPLQMQLMEAMMRLPENIVDSEKSAEAAAEAAEVKTIEGQKEGRYVVEEGRIYQVDDQGRMIEQSFPAAQAGAVKKLIAVRHAVTKQIEIELDENADDEAIESARKELNRLYDAFVESRGALNDRKNDLIDDDPEWPLVAQLEDEERKPVEIDVRGKKVVRYVVNYVKGPMLLRRVNFPHVEPTKADNLADAVSISINMRGAINPEFIGKLVSLDPEEARQKVIEEQLAFENPASGLLEPPDLYLSGFVKVKLAEAQRAAQQDAKYARNVEALTKVQPAPLPAEKIYFRLGSNWLSSDQIQRFLLDVLEVDSTVQFIRAEDATQWIVGDPSRNSTANRQTYSAGGVPGHELVMDSLNLKLTEVTTQVEDEHGNKKTIKLPKETAAARDMQDRIQAAFRDWVLKHPEEAQGVQDTYNQLFNGLVRREYQAPRVDYFPGASHDVQLRSWQKRGAARAVQEGTLFAHTVGTGKTYTIITTAMEMRRLGVAKKPMVVVQNSTLTQFANSFRRLYPAAQMLVGNSKQTDAKRRKQFVAKMATREWDAIIIPVSFFERIENDADREAAYVQEQLQNLEAMIREAEGRDYSPDKRPKSALGKQLQRVKRRFEARMERILERLKKKADDLITFEQLGVDALIVDEAHHFKRGDFQTKMDRVKGLDTNGSDRSMDFLLKTQWIHQKSPDKNVILATGTPISNTLAEMWTMMRYIKPGLLKQFGVDTFDDFVGTFATTKATIEETPTGGFAQVLRLARYVNGPELGQFWRSGADVYVLNRDDFKSLGMDVPEVKGGGPREIVIPRSEAVTKFVEFIRDWRLWWENLDGEQKAELSYVPILQYGLARKAAIDLRLVNPNLPDDPGSKVNRVVQEVFNLWRETTDINGTQLIFSNLYQSHDPKQRWLNEDLHLPNPLYGQAAFNLFDDFKRKLVKAGIPEGEIANFSTMDEKQRFAAAEQVKAGRIRIALGTTETLGTGLNLQDHIVAINHVDPQFRPMDFEQRNGRGIRQGNQNKEVGLNVFGVKNTMDSSLYELMLIKSKFVAQAMTADNLSREFEDPSDESTISFQAMAAAFSGNPLYAQRFALENDVRRLSILEEDYFRKLSEARSSLLTVQRGRDSFEKDVAVLLKSKAAMEAAFGDHKITKIEVKGVTSEGEEAKKVLDALFQEPLDEMENNLTAEFASGDLARTHEENIKKQNKGYFVSNIERERTRKATINGIPFEIHFTTQASMFALANGELQLTGKQGRWRVTSDLKLADWSDESPWYSSQADIYGHATTGGAFQSSLWNAVEKFSEREPRIEPARKRFDKMAGDLTKEMQKPFEFGNRLKEQAEKLAAVLKELEASGVTTGQQQPPKISDIQAKYPQFVYLTRQVAAEGSADVIAQIRKEENAKAKNAYYRLMGDGKYALIKGATPIKLTGFEWIDAFASTNKEDGVVSIFDSVSGIRIGAGKSTDEAKANALQKLSEAGEQKVRQFLQASSIKHGLSPRAKARDVDQATAFDKFQVGKLVRFDWDGTTYTGPIKAMAGDQAQAAVEVESGRQIIVPLRYVSLLTPAEQKAYEAEQAKLAKESEPPNLSLESPAPMGEGARSETSKIGSPDSESERLLRAVAFQRLVGLLSQTHGRRTNPRVLQMVEPQPAQSGGAGQGPLAPATWSAIESAFNARIIFLKGVEGFGIPFRGLNHPALPGYLFINANARNPALVTVGHELLHDLRLRDPALYAEVLAKLQPLMRDFNAYWQQLIGAYTQAGMFGLPEDAAQENLIADFVGDSFAEPELWNQLAAKEPSLFRRLADAVLNFLRRLMAKLQGFGSEKYFTDIAKAREVVSDALVKFAGRPPGEGRPGVLVTRNAVITPPSEPPSLSVTAHHGTPHKVDRFTTAKIGTGEGAQVYGWGLYFAENPEVSKQYSQALGHGYTVDGQPRKLRIWDEMEGADVTAADYAIKALHSTARPGFELANSRDKFPDSAKALEAIRMLNAGRVQKSGGNEYTVDLDVTPDELLDWDKPLSEQSAEVRNKLHKAALAHREAHANQTGAEIYRQAGITLGREEGPKAASLALARAGIKGIRYLDQGSRVSRFRRVLRRGGWMIEDSKNPNFSEGPIGEMIAAERRVEELDRQHATERTYNYVIFDEKDIQITHENGQPVTMQEAMGKPSFSLEDEAPVEAAGGDKVQVAGVEYDILGKERITREQKEQADARAAGLLSSLGFAGIADPAPDGDVFVLENDGQNHDAAATRLRQAIIEQVQTQFQPGGDPAYVSSLVNAVNRNFVLGRWNGVVSRQALNDLITTTISESSFRGQLLRAITGIKEDDVVSAGNNADIFLRRTYAKEFGGEQIEKAVRGALEGFKGELSDAEIEAALQHSEKFRDMLNKLTGGKALEFLKRVFAMPFQDRAELRANVEKLAAETLQVTPEAAKPLGKEFEHTFDGLFDRAATRALEVLEQAMSRADRRALGVGRRKGAWKMIERAVKAGKFDANWVLQRIAEAARWNVPTESELATVRSLAEEIIKLRGLSPDKIRALRGNKAELARAKVLQEAATSERRVGLKRRIETYWSRWTRPINLRTRKGWANAVEAGYEFTAANLLFKGGFLTRQSIDILTSAVFHLPNRAIAHALTMHGGFAGMATQEFWGDAGAILKLSAQTQLEALPSALREFKEALKGTAEIKNVDRLLSGIALFERVQMRADELTAKGRNAEAFVLRLFGAIRFSYRFASAGDNLQGVPQEWQEIKTQAFRWFRESGLNLAAAKLKADQIVPHLRAVYIAALPKAREILEETGKAPTKSEIDAGAWHIVKGMAYQGMKEAGMPSDDFENRNRLMRSTNAWNESMSGVASVGGVVSSAIKNIGQVGKNFPPVALFTGAFGRFGNAIGIGIDRTLTWGGLGLFPSAFGAGENYVDPNTGIAARGSPFFRTAEDRAQRKVEASIGLAFSAVVMLLVLARYLVVRNKWPKDKEDRELWDRMGWKPGTVALQLGDGKEIPLSMTVGPMALVRPWLVGSGAWVDALDTKAKAQAKLDADAARRGLPPGQAKSLDAADMLAIAGTAAWSAALGGRTAGGLIGSLTDYGVPNASKTLSALVSPTLPGLPALQEASRMAGVQLDKTATFLDFLVPLPTSSAAKVNLLGDPASNPNDLQRIVQILTGGTYPGVTDAQAARDVAGYSALFSTGFRPPSIDAAKGYAFADGFRPMTDAELGKYTQLRGQYLKDALVGLGDQPDVRAVRAAYATANRRALSELGVQVESPKTGQVAPMVAPSVVATTRPTSTGLRAARPLALGRRLGGRGRSLRGGFGRTRLRRPRALRLRSRSVRRPRSIRPAFAVR